MSDDYEDLRRAVADLEAALAGLREDLAAASQRAAPPSGGAPRADDAAGPDGDAPAGEEAASPDDALRLLEEVALPTLEGLLAANLETLEATRTAVREARRANGADDATEPGIGEQDVTDAAEDPRGDVTSADGRDEPFARRSDDAADRVGDAVDRVHAALDGSALPDDAPGRDLIEEARGLRDEVDERAERAGRDADRLRDAAAGRDPSADVEAVPDDEDGRGDGNDRVDGDDREQGAGTEDGGGRVDGGDGEDTAVDERAPVDVDAELETIRSALQRGDAAVRTDERTGEERTFDGSEDEPSPDGDRAAGAAGASDDLWDDDGGADGRSGERGDDVDGDGTDGDEGGDGGEGGDDGNGEASSPDA